MLHTIDRIISTFLRPVLLIGDSIMISKQDIKMECRRLEKSIEDKENFIANCDSGTFECFHNGNKWNWYLVSQSTDKTGKPHRKRKYLSKKKTETAKLFIKKEICRCELLDERQELKALRSYLNKCSSFSRAEKYINRNEEIGRITKSLYDEDNNFNESTLAWLNDINTDSQLFPEGLRFRCKNGLLVRSKSEQLIATTLIDHNIPFKYENKLMLGLNEYYPDFTILSPKDGSEYLWEHFGKMDDAEYVSRNYKKVFNYIENGYIPFENLIMTFESNNNGIDQIWIEKIIETFFI